MNAVLPACRQALTPAGGLPARTAATMIRESEERVMHDERPAVAWFDDLRLGMRFRSAGTLVTAADIKRFAAEFDPQP